MDQKQNLKLKWQIYAHLIFGKREKNYFTKSSSLFNKWCWQNQISICRRKKLGTYLSLCTKISSKWIYYLNLKHEMLKLFKKNIGVLFNILRQARIFKFFFWDLFIFISWVWVCCLHVCLYTTCVQYPQRPAEGVRTPSGTGIPVGC